MHDEHGKLLEEREQQKADANRQKILDDKNSRDQQLKDEQRRRKTEAKETMNQEKQYISRLK